MLQHRTFDISGRVAQAAYKWLVSNCSVGISMADIIVGYRADDSYFSYARDFINNAISLEELGAALRLGNLGKQVVLKSARAYRSIQYTGYELVDYDEYSMRYKFRDSEAGHAYFNRDIESGISGTYIMDLMRGRI